ncbi:TIGR02444 family protein [Halomonas halocynthiae]|uniref:TIGR02444 family protein n=1 Tax=Halomonas halocynthiae TaxID=176290 RepID=UPI000418F8E7|nr:TIGR02444 family protein [Halomonas halocynthiae]
MNTNSTELTPQMRRELKNHPLWNFALTLYARPGVEKACLTLQDDAGLDVCELLWMCWLSYHGLTLTEHAALLLNPVRTWQREITAPLRLQRRTLKPLCAGNPEREKLRQTIKQAELLAEQEALRQLEQLTYQGHVVRAQQATDDNWTVQAANRVSGDAQAAYLSLDVLASQARCN